MTPTVQANQPNNPYDLDYDSDDDELTPEELSRYNEAALASDVLFFSILLSSFLLLFSQYYFVILSYATGF